MSLPLGAALSIGTTSTTKSDGFNKSPTILNLGSSVGACLAIISFSSYIFSFVVELTHIVFDLEFISFSSMFCCSLTKSSLFMTTM